MRGFGDAATLALRVKPDEEGRIVQVRLNDCKDMKELPASVGKPFVDAPGTFVEGMEGRKTEAGMTVSGVKVMRMSRVEMLKSGSPHDAGITWEKFSEHRGYALPGYEPKHPKDGEDAPAETDEEREERLEKEREAAQNAFDRRRCGDEDEKQILEAAERLPDDEKYLGNGIRGT